MEITLNLSWAACSLALVWFWCRGGASEKVSRRTQVMALGMVLLLLLPVISLSDDLMAMQGPAETDTSMRRALHLNEGHPVPVSFALPEPLFAATPWGRYSPAAVRRERLAAFVPVLTRSLDRRPPPQA
jgi:hypothetical protein